LSHSNFGTIDTDTSRKMRAAFADIRRRDPDLEIEGEMQADVALSETVRDRVMPNSRLTGQANLFIMPNVESANIAFNMLKTLSDGVSIGPLLLGVARPAHILTPSVTARGIINITSIASVGAQIFDDAVIDHTTHRLVRSVS
ncbi:MAG: NADP-dependent malic enzyme, partial [Alphaproteobacteria bacterium]|nr:NADP-dependent malic enzyme [Alphaproteobacteria bacterium]MCB1839811.1 NADP-dependent malic enzyme [Alphaproteobacteria bacterium]